MHLHTQMQLSEVPKVILQSILNKVLIFCAWSLRLGPLGWIDFPEPKSSGRGLFFTSCDD